MLSVDYIQRVRYFKYLAWIKVSEFAPKNLQNRDPKSENSKKYANKIL